MRTRLLFGPILIAVLLAGLWLDHAIQGVRWPLDYPPLGFDGTAPPGVVVLPVMLAIAALGGRELALMLKAKGIHASRLTLAITAVIGLLVSTPLFANLARGDGAAGLASAAAAMVLVGILHHARTKNTQGAMLSIGAVLFGFAYLGLTFGFLLRIRLEHSAWVLVWVLATVKSCDIFAYFTGKAIGKHKLIPWLSPGKTWEGLVGGMIGSAIVGGAGLAILTSREIFDPGGSPIGMALVGALAGACMGLAGQLGDLMASMMKRDAGIKDSSTLLPGFGGVLDVIDSPILVAPLAYWTLAIWA
jgi:phosphatidate cytidylyltransferase